jgi:hypothetical protein
MPLPITGERKTFVKSMKPSGVKVAAPILKKRGAAGSPFCPWGSAAAGVVEEDAAVADDAFASAVAEGALSELTSDALAALSVAVLAALALVALPVLPATPLFAANAGDATTNPSARTHPSNARIRLLLKNNLLIDY